MTKQVPGWIVGLTLFVVLVIGVSIFGQTANRHPLYGKPAAPVSGPTADGGSFSLGEQKGKVVLVNFWGTWCGPCQMEIPDLVALQEKYQSAGFTIVGIALDDEPGVSNEEDLARVNDFARKAGINYPSVLGSRELQDAYGGVPAVPTSFLVNKEGNIVGVWVGLITRDQLTPEIEKYL